MQAAGVLGGRAIDADGVTRLATLPSREVLLAKLAGGTWLLFSRSLRKRPDGSVCCQAGSVAVRDAMHKAVMGLPQAHELRSRGGGTGTVHLPIHRD